MMYAEAPSGRAGRHAVIIGAGIAGLIAARVLSDHFVRVTVLDRDLLPDEAAPRVWGPHGLHAHLLAHRGQEIIEQLFPGLFTAIGPQGSVAVDLGSQMLWRQAGITSIRARTGVLSRFQSGYALETQLRRQLRTFDNVCILQDAQVAALRTNCAGAAISAVEVVKPVCGQPRQTGLTVDLVVDASGRASQLPRWLQMLGYDCPAQDEVAVDYAYASRIYRRPAGYRCDWLALQCDQDPQVGSRSVRIFPLEGDRWIVTAGGRFGERPPVDADGFLKFLEPMLDAHLIAALRTAEPVGPVVAGRIGSNQRRCYESLKRFPERLVVIGDALCSLHPWYGNGVAVAAEQALALDRCLRSTRGNLTRAARDFLRVAGQVVDRQWQLAACEELRHAQASSPRPPFLAALDWFRHRVQVLSARDALAMQTLLDVTHMRVRPTAICKPALACKVAASLLPGRRADSPARALNMRYRP
jgi:2-polyprenyl-6-methoxyphenol hydroxylase-like FAD-dependent oxidoreductase